MALNNILYFSRFLSGKKYLSDIPKDPKVGILGVHPEDFEQPQFSVSHPDG